MMRRETLKERKWLTRKMGYYPSAAAERELIVSHLEALNLIDELKAKLNQAATEEEDRSQRDITVDALVNLVNDLEKRLKQPEPDSCPVHGPFEEYCRGCFD